MDQPVLTDPHNLVLDPWANREASMKCATCMWFVVKAPSNAIGRCRRHAPTMHGYPVVYSNDWCGDHKLNEHTGGDSK